MQSPHAVTVPGAIDGWVTLLADHGTKTLGASPRRPPSRMPRTGFVVAPRVAADWAVAYEKLRNNKGASLNCLKDGRAPRVGEIMRFPALARTLRRIADEGRDGFYAGEVAADMVAELTRSAACTRWRTSPPRRSYATSIRSRSPIAASNSSSCRPATRASSP